MTNYRPVYQIMLPCKAVPYQFLYSWYCRSWGSTGFLHIAQSKHEDMDLSCTGQLSWL